MSTSEDEAGAMDMGEFDYQLSGTVHNFGVFKGRGKKTIFQINLKDRKILLIQRGAIKSSFDFDQFEEYESEENTSISVKFIGKTFQFDAANHEEKDAICHLLGIVQSGRLDIIEDSSENKEPHGAITMRSASVIKEGIVEKKGNAAISFWSRRRIRITPGMLSYFKPDETVTLNILQLRENGFDLKETGSNGFNIVFPRRTYCFRILNDKSTNVQEERASWLRAFQTACTQKRKTVIFCKKKLELSTLDFQPIDNYNLLMNKDNGRTRFSSDVNEGEEKDKDVFYDTVGEDEKTSDPETESVTKRVSKVERPETLSVYVPRSEPLPALTLERSKKPQSTNKPTVVSPRVSLVTEHEEGEEHTGADDILSEEVFEDRESADCTNSHEFPDPDYSDDSDNENIYVNESQIHKAKDIPKEKSPNSDQDKKSKPVATPRETTKNDEEKSVTFSLPNKLPNHPESQASTPENITSENSTVTYGNITEFSDHSVQSNVSTKSDTGHCEVQTDKVEGRSDQLSTSGPDVPVTNNRTTIAQMTNLFESLSVASPVVSTSNEITQGTEHLNKTTVIPKVLTTLPALPAPPAPPPPPPMPVVSSKAKSKEPKKFRTVHWSAVPKTQIKESFWKGIKGLTSEVDMDLLKEHFCLTDGKTKVSKGTNEKQKMLLDPRRARNLAIILNGIKSHGAFSIQSVLTSVQEDERFPSEKLATIRRFQPTQDDIDMYRLYKDKKHKLDPVDRFMLELCNIQCLELRLDFVLLLWDFPGQLKQNSETVTDILTACDTLLSCKQLTRVLGYVLSIGNKMNSNNKLKGFQISSVGRFMEMRGKRTDYTFLHFLTEHLLSNDPDLLEWTSSLQCVIKCKDKSVNAIATEIDVMKGDLSKMKQDLKMLKRTIKKQTSEDTQFLNESQMMMVGFEGNLHYLDKDARAIQTKYRQVLSFFGESVNLPSEEFFAAVAEFIMKFDKAKSDFKRVHVTKKRES